MKTSLPVVFLSALFTLFVFSSAKAQILNPAAPALGFHVFVQDNMTAKTGNVSGAVAVGGDLTLRGSSSFAMNNSGSYPLGAGNANNFGLVINRRIVYTGGNTTYVNRGLVRLGNTTGSRLHDKDQNNSNTNLRITAGGFNSNPQIQLQRVQPSATVIQPSDINFTNAFLQMNQFSASMNTLIEGNAVNLLTIPSGANPHIRLTANKTNLINLTSGQLNALANQGSLIFDNKPGANQPLVINVKVTGDLTWNVPNLAGVGDADGAYLIWNFYTTSSITIAGNSSLFGTLMAPSANVIKNGNGNFNGQIIAKSFELNGGTINYHPLNINLVNVIPAPIMLPLEGIDLSAQLQGSSVRLSWMTYGESEMEAYVAEASTDGRIFTALKSIQTKGSGNHTYYTNIDAQAYNGNVYFRIKAVERSGKAYYSKIALVKMGNTVRFQTWPNPVTDKIFISFSATQNNIVSVDLLDSHSTSIKHEIYQANKGINQWSIDNLGHLPSGIYFLKVYNLQTGETAVQKISK